MMTFKDLKKLVELPSYKEQRVPTVKALEVSGVPVVTEKVLENHGSMPLFFILSGIVYNIARTRARKAIQIKKILTKYIEWSGIYLVFDYPHDLEGTAEAGKRRAEGL